MVLAKSRQCRPRDLAALFAERFKKIPMSPAPPSAGPGFINLKIDDGIWRGALRDVLTEGVAYGDANVGKGEPINVEYVSANPTGPMHVGHARGAVVGDALARLLAKAGFAVTKEYYINDAGGQVDNVAAALRMRYLQVLGKITEADVKSRARNAKRFNTAVSTLFPAAEALVARDGDKWTSIEDRAQWVPALRDFTVAFMMKIVKKTCGAGRGTRCVHLGKSVGCCRKVKTP